ncbi:MAG TPA: hypothetical protein VGR73_09170 [Bryobacteraceae bacterium]|nr:hypothetical protein [Bryobacteraceae bacterium]
MTTNATTPPMLDSQLLTAFVETFAGYGNLDAPYWYVGMEEGGDSTSFERRVSVWRDRGSSIIEDLREYHVAIKLEDLFVSSARLQSTWKQLIRITLRAEGLPCSVDAIREYQARQLGRRDGGTALLELYPLPART